MKDVNKVLAVSWITQSCKETIHFAISQAANYGAELAVIHVIDTKWMSGWNLPMKYDENEHNKDMEKIKAELDTIINREKKGGMKIKTVIKSGHPVEEILKFIEKEKVDLVVLRANAESRIERFIIGSSNDEIIRRMPCSVLLVKNESGRKASRTR